jgi:hypothetical protein
MVEGAMVIVVRGRCFLRKGQVPRATSTVSPPASKFSPDIEGWQKRPKFNNDMQMEVEIGYN